MNTDKFKEATQALYEGDSDKPMPDPANPFSDPDFGKPAGSLATKIGDTVSGGDVGKSYADANGDVPSRP